MALLSLTYVSSAVSAFSRPELVELLEESREKNDRCDISGMLLYKDGNFMQVIEGREHEIRPLFDKIQGDPRHRGVMRLREEEIPEREFPGWSMGFRDLSGTADVPGYSDFMNDPLTADEFGEDPSRAQRLLLSFKRRM